jgi:hypothetical protein
MRVARHAAITWVCTSQSNDGYVRIGEASDHTYKYYIQYIYILHIQYNYICALYNLSICIYMDVII